MAQRQYTDHRKLINSQPNNEIILRRTSPLTLALTSTANHKVLDEDKVTRDNVSERLVIRGSKVSGSRSFSSAQIACVDVTLG